MNIKPTAGGKEIVGLALAIHELVNRLPLTMRTRDMLGVRIEDGEVLDYDYTGPILEKVLIKGEISREVPETGPYQGIPVVVVPIIEDQSVIAAVGLVDMTKGIYSDIIEITKRPKDEEGSQ
jgi:hypothetical protein